VLVRLLEGVEPAAEWAEVQAGDRGVPSGVRRRATAIQNEPRLTTRMNFLDFPAAVAVMRLAAPAGSALTVGPIDPDEIVRHIVRERRERAPGCSTGGWATAKTCRG
jgi:hypothetical protein